MIEPDSGLIPEKSSGEKPPVGASLLAKNFASKLAPTIKKSLTDNSG
jgi:hypothetical protein